MLRNNIGYVYDELPITPKIPGRKVGSISSLDFCTERFLHRELIHLESENASVSCLLSPFGLHCTFHIFIICTTVRGMDPARITTPLYDQGLALKSLQTDTVLLDFNQEIMSFHTDLLTDLLKQNWAGE